MQSARADRPRTKGGMACACGHGSSKGRPAPSCAASCARSNCPLDLHRRRHAPSRPARRGDRLQALRPLRLAGLRAYPRPARCRPDDHVRGGRQCAPHLPGRVDPGPRRLRDRLRQCPQRDPRGQRADRRRRRGPLHRGPGLSEALRLHQGPGDHPGAGSRRQAAGGDRRARRARPRRRHHGAHRFARLRRRRRRRGAAPLRGLSCGRRRHADDHRAAIARGDPHRARGLSGRAHQAQHQRHRPAADGKRVPRLPHLDRTISPSRRSRR